uniref:Pecanex-like protein n=1 Tax=Macrostomum lignano TaxID=282301 RepID=A0A1I8I402_9PLAT
AILPQLASCADSVANGNASLVVLADDDVVDWDPDNPPQNGRLGFGTRLLCDLLLCVDFLNTLENRDVAKQGPAASTAKKDSHRHRGLPDQDGIGAARRRPGRRHLQLRPAAVPPSQLEKEENRHVDFQCVVQVKNDATSDNGGGLQAAAVERPVDLPPSLTPPLPVGNNGNDNSPNQDVELNGVDGGSVDDVMILSTK